MVAQRGELIGLQQVGMSLEEIFLHLTTSEAASPEAAAAEPPAAAAAASEEVQP